MVCTCCVALECIRSCHHKSKRHVLCVDILFLLQLPYYIQSCSILHRNGDSWAGHPEDQLVAELQRLLVVDNFLNWEATALHVTARHVTSRHVTSRHIMSRDVTSPHLTSPHLKSSHIPYHTTQHQTRPYHTMLYHAVPCRAVPCPAMPCPAMPCHAMQCLPARQPARTHTFMNMIIYIGPALHGYTCMGTPL